MLRTCHRTMALLALVPSSICFASDGAVHSRTIDVIHYRISIDWDGTAGSITARADVLLKSRIDSLMTILLDFDRLAVDSVTVSGTPASFRQDSSAIIVTASPCPHRGDTLTCSISYHGHPGAGLSLATTKFGDPCAFADNWPDRAHTWFPCVDHPSDKATVEFLLTAPDRFEIVANGQLEEVTEQPDGKRLWHWKEEGPIPTYSMVFGAAEFSVQAQRPASCIPVSHYYYYRDRRAAAGDFGRTTEILGYFDALIGPYPYEKLSLVESSTRFGGMENASAIFLNEHRIGEGRNLESLCAHEIAHQWFGNSVTPADWPDLWLSEGFAEYFQKLFTGRNLDRKGRIAEIREIQDTYLRFDPEGGARLVPTGEVQPRDLLNPVAYQKGASVLHMLRFELGDSLFTEGIRGFYAAYQHGNATTADLQRYMERVAGHPLTTFFRQWTTFPGYPRLHIRPTWEERENLLRVDVEQTQTGLPFQFPLEILAGTGRRESRQTFRITRGREEFRLPLETKPDYIIVDPDCWILKIVTVDRLR